MEIAMNQAQALVAQYGLDVVAAIVVLVVGRVVARWLANLIGSAMRRARTDETLVKFAVNVAYVALLAFVAIAALARLGVQTTSFIAVLGAAGLAIGLALQGSLSNFAAGVMLILFKPFKVGDYVEAGGAAGTVEEIQIFSTRMRSPDNRELYVPNGAIFGGNIVNYSAKETRRVDMVFGCSYDDDVRAVKALLESMVAADERILADPPPQVAVSELGDSSINFVVRPWVKSADYWAVRFDFHEAVKLRFDEAGISIPYPQQDVHMHQAA